MIACRYYFVSSAIFVAANRFRRQPFRVHSSAAPLKRIFLLLDRLLGLDSSASLNAASIK